MLKLSRLTLDFLMTKKLTYLNSVSTEITRKIILILLIVIKSDNKYNIVIDDVLVSSGSLLEDFT